MKITVIIDCRYKENSKLRSKIFKDHHMNPMDLAVYWVEYVLRYNGAGHLKSSSTALSFTSYFNVEFCIVFIVVIAVCVFLIVKTVKYIIVQIINNNVDPAKKKK